MTAMLFTGTTSRPSSMGSADIQRYRFINTPTTEGVVALALRVVGAVQAAACLSFKYGQRGSKSDESISTAH